MEIIKIGAKILNEEKETLLNYDFLDKKWYADTTIVKHYNRFLKQGWKQVVEYQYDDGTPAGGQFEAPERAITIRNTEKKQMSEKQMGNLHSCFNDDEDVE